jgi:aspartate/methionine/tyrosine aminotransferase
MIMEVESPEQIGYEQVRYNLAESSMADRRLGDLGVNLDDLLLSYGDHRGEPGLREYIASDSGVHPNQVLVCVGAAGALFTVATALLNAGDRLVVAHPNYASNLETPYAIGAEIVSLPLTLEGSFQVDLDHLRTLITPGTKLVSLTTPHNPTGAVIPPDDLRQIIRMVEEAGAWLLLDETYRELSDTPPPAVTLSEHVLSVSSLSKTYGVPGIRIGWVLCRDTQLMETLLAAKEQIALAHSVVDEAIARAILERRDTLLPGIRTLMREHRQLVSAWMASEPWLEWVEPQGGVVCFPRIVPGSSVEPARFYQTLNERYATWVGPGHWFEQDPHHFRLGFGYPTTSDLKQALINVSQALSDAKRGD